MAKPTTRAEFKDYCLRNLGKPVINIEVDDDQVDDRIDEALEMYADWHYDATEEQWIHYQITADDVTNEFITVPDDIMVVTKVMPASLLSAATSSNDMFSYQYQIMVSELTPWEPFDSVDYYLKMLSVEETRNLIDVEERFRFVRHEHKVRLYKDYHEGDNLIMRVHRILDPDVVWNDKWLKMYATALIKRQWGANTKKYDQVQLLGGVTINGQQFFEEALAEIERLEELLKTHYSEPPPFIVG